MQEITDEDRRQMNRLVELNPYYEQSFKNFQDREWIRCKYRKYFSNYDSCFLDFCRLANIKP